MINFHKILSVFSIIFILWGCSSTPEKKPVPKKLEPEHVVGGMTVPERAQMTVRDTEIIRVLHTGRYVDPSNPNMMHEAGRVYVVKRSPTWNTRPNTPVFSPGFSDRLKVRGNKYISIQERNYRQQQSNLRMANKKLSALITELKRSRAKLNKLSKAAKKDSQLQPEVKKLKAEVSLIVKRLGELEIGK